MRTPSTTDTKPRHSRGSLRTWRWEILGPAASVILLIAMAVLLSQYDSKPIFSWNGVNLNAIVAILSTASKATLAYTIDEIISQWKWILFGREPRVLMDFQRIDSASRGPLGSFFLLFNPKFKKPVLLRLGVLITVVATAWDPFSQQLIQNTDGVEYFPNSTVGIPACQRYSQGNEHTISSLEFSETWADNTSLVFTGTDLVMQSAILSSLNTPFAEIPQQLRYVCSSQNCTFEPFESLAVCSTCNDVSSKAVKQQDSGILMETYLDNTNSATIGGDGTTFLLPNGLSISNGNKLPPKVHMTFYGTPFFSETVSFQDDDAQKNSMIWSVTLLKATQKGETNWPAIDLEATECALSYCVNRYESKVQDGKLVEDVTRVDSAVRSPNSWQPLVYPTWGSRNNIQQPFNDSMAARIAFSGFYSIVTRTDLSFNSPSKQFNLSQSAVDSISEYFQNTFAGPSKMPTTPFSITRLNGWYMGDSVYAQYRPSIVDALWNAQGRNATDIFAGIATSMSNALRMRSDSNLMVGGLLGKSVTYYRIEWGWLALHAALTFATIIFLAVTIWKTRQDRTPAWKSSALAVMGRERGALGCAATVEEMEQRAREETVQFSMAVGQGGSASEASYVPTSSREDDELGYRNTYSGC